MGSLEGSLGRVLSRGLTDDSDRSEAWREGPREHEVVAFVQLPKSVSFVIVNRAWVLVRSLRFIPWRRISGRAKW